MSHTPTSKQRSLFNDATSNKWIWLSLTYATGAVEVNASGVIVQTPPIWKWMCGKKWEKVLKYLTEKKQVERYENG